MRNREGQQRARLACLFFFFQAEDGIRDYKVTGVQTCALPISPCLRTRAGLPTPVGRHADRVLPSVPAEHLYGKTDETDVRLDICDGQEGADENTRWRSLTTLHTVQFVERLLDLTALGHELRSGEPGQQTLVVVPGGVPLPDRDKHPVVFYRAAPPRPSRFQEGAVGVDEVHRVSPPGLALVPGRLDQRVVQVFEFAKHLPTRLRGRRDDELCSGLVAGGA